MSTNEVLTNLPLALLVMDDRENGKDSRYYCLPPFYGDITSIPSPQGKRGFPLHLVFQGHRVGIFKTWAEAKASLTGYPGSGNQGCYSVDECIDVWQGMCPPGIHPHPADPAFMRTPSASAATFVNTSPRKGRGQSTSGSGSGSGSGAESASPVKREGSAQSLSNQAPAPTGPPNAQLLADLKRLCSPIRSASPTRTPRGASEHHAYMNFAIRGDGVISSSPLRSRARYLELQRQGAAPDMLVTRSFEHASLFAVEDAEEDADDLN
ncbi:hypothetical protein C8R47DRAFT_1231037 [Mycena vitilis]|nr:hypothetical protein C8R47DRAFT_1231037 [Mycena vitilis]